MGLAAGVLAHGGGAPEAATVLIPLLIVIAFVVKERKNVRKLREQQQEPGEDEPT
ncbi:MAG: hypothetical protein JJD92_15615 [Frankiaceae bacterium]|nr:hypothetical protein [Frankiaceae bacterium]